MTKKTSGSTNSNGALQASGQISVARPAKPEGQPSIFLAVPSYKDSFCGDFVASLMGLTIWAQKTGTRLKLQMFNYADISATRNILLSMFYYGQTDFTHLLFIDDDMGFDTKLLVDSLALEQDVVGAFYPKRSVDLRGLHSGADRDFDTAYANSTGFVGQKSKVSFKKGRFVTADYVGTGFMLLRRSGIDNLIKKMPGIVQEKRYDGVLGEQRLSKYLIAFDRTLVNGREYSEDYAFCLRHRKAGGKVWAAEDASLTHVGQIKVNSRFDKM